MVQKNSSALEAAGVQASTLCAETQQRLAADMTDLAAIHSSSLECSTSHCKALDTAAAGTFSSNKKALEAAGSSREKADGVLAGISGTVGVKRKFLDCTVTGLVGEVGAAIAQGCTSVDATSEMANKVLKDISGATSKMNKSASDAMGAFTNYLGQEGQAISAGLGAHFKATESHLLAQKRGLGDICEDARSHGDSIRGSVLESSGSTPTRRSVQPLRERTLRNTRAHSLIVEEVKAGHWRAPADNHASQVYHLSGQGGSAGVASTPHRSTSVPSTTAKKRRAARAGQPLGRLGSASQEDDKALQKSLSLGSTCSADSSDLEAAENVPPVALMRCDSGDNSMPPPSTPLGAAKKGARGVRLDLEEQLPSGVSALRRTNSNTTVPTQL